MVTFQFLFMTVTIKWNKEDDVKRIEDDMRITRIMEEMTDTRAKHIWF